MSDNTDRPAPVAFSHPTTTEPHQARTDEDGAARDVEFTAPTAAQPAARHR